MHCSSSVWFVLVFLTLMKHTGGENIRESKKNLHHHMTKREIEYFFGVSDLSGIPEYDVTTPHQTELNGRTMSKFRRRRSAAHLDVLHYKLHAFGSKLRLRLKRNKMLMAPNLVIERHHGGGVVTTHPAPKNKFYLGKVSSVPGSLVALRNDKGLGLSGMIRMSDDTFFVQPLPIHLARRVSRSADTKPHLIFRASPLKQDAFHCQMNQSVNYRFRRSAHGRNPRAASDQFKILEAALIAPQNFVDKYGEDEFATVLLVIGNMVAGMYQDPSIGKIRVFYVVKRIFHIKNISEVGFSVTDGGGTKLTKLLSWSAQYMTKDDSDPDHFDVFSYLSDKIVGGRALANHMCAPRKPNGNINSDVGLQSALYVAHETGHNFYLDHDVSDECPQYKYIMSGSLPSGVYAATWSNCSSRVIQQFLRGSNSKCLDDSPFDSALSAFPTVAPVDEHKLPGELFDGRKQCEMQYGPGYQLSPYRKGICDKLYCIKGGTELSRLAPMADGTPCGIRDWCIGGECQDNGKKRINGGWSSWSKDYESCTRACGGGVQHRQRTCTNPPTSDGGKPCEGSDKTFKICNSTPCPPGTPTLRQDQCSVRWTGSSAHSHGSDPCQLYCRISSTLKPKGTVDDGTRCYFDQSKLDVCVQGKCRKVGCDNKLDSNAMVDRCGKCLGNGDECLVIKSNYTLAHTEQGPENADVIVELPVGTFKVYFEMRKATYNNLGVQDENGTYLCGGHLGRNQNVEAADTRIVYTNKRRKYKDRITIAGPITSLLKVMYICRQQGANPGTDYNFIRPVQDGETPPVSKYQWNKDTWTPCSVTCGEGVRSRSIRCQRADDLSPASDAACGATIPHTKERCIAPDCPSAWYTTDWSDCSKSCGSGQQTRKVECRKKINAIDYGPGNNCSNDSKPVISETLRSCNKFACASDWDTKEGLPNIDCGDPIDLNSLYCYRMDQFAQRDLVPKIMCRNMAKPTRLPCTTQPIPTTLPGPESTVSSTTSTKPTTRRSQAGQAQCSAVFTLLILLLHLTWAFSYSFR